jgi:hypothetical protein
VRECSKLDIKNPAFFKPISMLFTTVPLSLKWLTKQNASQIHLIETTSPHN